MLRLAAAVLLVLVLPGAVPLASPATPSVQSVQAHAGSPLARLRALAGPTRLAQVQCPEPEQGESFCGVYGSECIYCPSTLPHACLAQNKCFETLAGAQAACGNEWVVCSRPAG
jgi:hypothetical protein